MSGLLFWHNNPMGLFKSKKEHGYCAFCKSPKWIYKTRNIGFLGFFVSLVCSFIFGNVAFHEFNPLVVVVFVMLLVLVELLVHIRWRMSVVCRQCGFDPLIYKKDHQLAADKVRAHLEKRSQSADWLLSRPLNLPTRKHEDDLKVALRNSKNAVVPKQGSRLSKQV